VCGVLVYPILELLCVWRGSVSYLTKKKHSGSRIGLNDNDFKQGKIFDHLSDVYFLK
jgi:hypothetical protein